VYNLILITCSNKTEAKKISNYLVKNKLAACVNIIYNIESSYWWKNKIETSKECLLIVKTLNTLVNKLIKEVKKIHTYTVPEIISLSITKGNKDYFNWIKDSLK